MKRRFAIALVFATLAAVGIAQTAGQAKPNFAGTWKLNLQKSDLGQMAPDSETYTVAQTDTEVKVTIASESQFGKMNYTFAAKLDGTDTPLAADAFPAESPFRILTSKAEWQGSSLVITQTTSFQDAKGTLKSTYTLSDDGKVLTKATHVTFDQGDFDSKSVYDKA
jgi:methionine synthase II (cobalamin-independent)